MKRLLFAVSLLLSGVAGVAIELDEEPVYRPVKPKAEPASPQWRGRERPSEAAKRKGPKVSGEAATPEKPEKREKFAPGHAPEGSRVTPEAPAAANEEDQWRRSPADRRWESWREFPPKKQVDLWRSLTENERLGYWDAMNVHERATLWLKMRPEEKDVYWERLADGDRESLCDALPPNEAALWRPRLSNRAVKDAEESRSQFRPAKPEPGYTPKSMYREDDEQ